MRLALGLSAMLTGLLLGGAGVQAADLARLPRVQEPPDLLQQTRPAGIASDWPRSPLADGLSNGVERFDRWTDAKFRCPRDTLVWVPDSGQRYHAVLRDHAPGPESGAFMCQADASAEGDWH